MLPFYLIASPRHPLVLGLTWLEAHNPIVDWCNRSVTFRDPECSQKTLKVSTVSTHPLVISEAVSDIVNGVPNKYKDFSDVFEKRNVNRRYDCSIDLQEGACPPFGPIYGLSTPELKALQGYLDENLEKGSFCCHLP